jgi:cell division protein FtsI/penicillin-binding protein 2
MDRWYDEETKLAVMIGKQRHLQVRPIDVACAYATLFNGGKLFHFSSSGKPVGRRQVIWEKDKVNVIRTGMKESALRGTGSLAGDIIKPLFVKTGTTINTEGKSAAAGSARSTEGWCIAVATECHPPILALAYIKPGRGASDAAPLAAESIKLYLNLTANRP